MQKNMAWYAENFNVLKSYFLMKNHEKNEKKTKKNQKMNKNIFSEKI